MLLKNPAQKLIKMGYPKSTQMLSKDAADARLFVKDKNGREVIVCLASQKETLSSQRKGLAETQRILISLSLDDFGRLNIEKFRPSTSFERWSIESLSVSQEDAPKATTEFVEWVSSQSFV